MRASDLPATPARPRPTRGAEAALVLLFLVLIVAVPATQTALELARGERVQFTDVFRIGLNARELRQYEATLKEKSWCQRYLRPQVQRFLFAVLRDPGARAILGRNHWLFYRPDVRYLVEPERREPPENGARGIDSARLVGSPQSVLLAIRGFHDRLRERGIALLVVPIPSKPSVYPDQLSARFSPSAGPLPSPTLGFLHELDRLGIASVDLFHAFADLRQAQADRPLYLRQDTHWTPAGAERAAQQVAARILELGLVIRGDHPFQTVQLPVARWGDLLDMMQTPGLRQHFAPEEVVCTQVRDSALGAMVPAPSDRPGTYRYPGKPSPVLVLGDSFSRIYHFPEPRSLGATLGRTDEASTSSPASPGPKRLLPGSAGFVAHLALALGTPVDAIVSDGGASTDVRHKLSTHPEILENKRVVVWEFAERDLALGRAGWEDVPLPPELPR